MATKAAQAAQNTGPSDVTVSSIPQTELTVNLLGTEYTIVPPKAAMAINVAMLASQEGSDAMQVIQALYRWLDKAFGQNSEAVKERLMSEDDELDLGHIVNLIKGVIEKQTGNPTT